MHESTVLVSFLIITAVCLVAWFSLRRDILQMEEEARKIRRYLEAKTRGQARMIAEARLERLGSARERIAIMIPRLEASIAKAKAAREAARRSPF